MAELKRIIADWPETDAFGEPTEVWIETGDQLSGPCTSVWPLNRQIIAEGTQTSDLLLCHSR